MIIKISAVLAVAITVMLLMAMTVNPAFAGSQVVDEEKGAVDHVTGSSSQKAKEIEPIDVKMERVKSIVDFDDISLPPDTYQQIINYAGITWDSGLPDFGGGSDGGWWVYNNKSYAEAVSPPNYVFNGRGAKNPGFDFSSIVKFNGAYFMNVEHGDCPSAVRFVGYASGVPIYYSGWLTLNLKRKPAYLSANFPGVDRVVVEMDGDGWFAMDDLSVGLSDKPDLEITDIWHEGSKIYYKIKNIGEAKAGSSKTELWVDGVSKKTDSVRSLGAGVERTESFRYKWTCSYPSDKIEVCADYKNAVVESNEANNCNTETWVVSYPDLIITDIWHEGSKIYYKIKNIGEAKAGSSKTELWVDGISKKTDSVKSLGAGVERTESFRYKWTCSYPSDKIEVCADYKNAVVESNEANNCNTETWVVSYPDLIITDIWHEGSKIYYKIKNIGEAKAGSSKTELWVDGVSKKTDSVKSLGAGVERTESFRYKWTCSGASDMITVCADYKNAVDESDDGNNCKTETLENGGNGDKPDLVITDIWHEGSKIYYKIKNIGTEEAGSSRTSLTVDGDYKKYDSVRTLGAGEERTESFRYDWTCTGTSDEIEVCADYKNAVAESNEGNNCKTETLENGGNGDKPDLVITDIWHEESKIYYKIKNTGAEKAGSSRTSLTVDGDYKKYDSVRTLGAGEERTESFRYDWTCTEPSDEIKVCADYKNAVAESEEGNNCKTETWGVEYWAVIAGSPQCWLADNDAYDMYDGLLSYPNWKAENIRLLVDDCTRANVQAGIAWMASQADADDVCLFFYAGHGTHDTDIAPIDEADGWDEYICPEGNVPGTFIRDDELDAWMTTPIKGKKVVIIDSCHSGGFIRGEGVRTIPGVPYAELTDGFVRDLNKPGYVTLTAADDDESAWGSGDLNNGVFTYYVVEGLGGPANTDGDNDISAEETYDYAEPGAIDYSSSHPEWCSSTQHPQLYDGVTGEQPVVKWS